MGRRIDFGFHFVKDDLPSSLGNLPSCFATSQPGTDDDNGFHRSLFYLVSSKFAIWADGLLALRSRLSLVIL